MNKKIRDLLDQIAALEDDLRVTVQEQEASALYEIRGKRIEFEASVRQAHQRLKQGFFRWLVTNRPQNLITGPIIYSMIVPLLLLDLCVSFYQASCFPIYGIRKVRRGDYIVFDRQQLDYLNFIEKFHCSYCAYGNGLMNMARIAKKVTSLTGVVIDVVGFDTGAGLPQAVIAEIERDGIEQVASNPR